MEVAVHIFLILSGVQIVFCELTDEQVIHSHLKYFLGEMPESVSENQLADIRIEFKLNQIIDIDERQQILTTSVFIEQKWFHSKLTWAHLNNNSVKAVRLLESSLWLPDTYVFNNADDVQSGFLSGHYVLVTQTGYVIWPIRLKLKTFCPMDISMFPFDRQTCRIQIGSWMHRNSNGLHYVFSETAKQEVSVDLTAYTDNSDWILAKAVLQEAPGGGVEIVLNLNRRSFFYIWILIVPFVMLTFLSLLTFYMPSHTKEKLSLGLSVFMAFSMFMIMISERIPPATNHVPLIGIYLSTVMTMAASSVCVTVLIINLYQRKGFQRPSFWIRRLCISRLAPIFKVRYTKLSRESMRQHLSQTFQQLSNRTFLPYISKDVILQILVQVLSIGGYATNLMPRFQSRSNKERHPMYRNRINNATNSLHESLNFTIRLNRVKNNKLEWELIAIVLDHIFFYIFVIIYVFIYGAIFLTPFRLKY